METTKTFSIENEINPDTGKPFGSKYAGTFSIRRPTLLDTRNISIRYAASMSVAGPDISLIGESIKLISYTFAFIETVSDQAIPEWFNVAALYPEDENAVYAVWTEVNKFLDSFRPEADR